MSAESYEWHSFINAVICEKMQINEGRLSGRTQIKRLEFSRMRKTLGMSGKEMVKTMTAKKMLIAILLLIGIAAVIFVRFLYDRQILDNQIALVLTILIFLIILPSIYCLEKKQK